MTVSNRIKMLEKRAKSILLRRFPLFAQNDDKFIEALGLSPEHYQVKNADGSTGYDFIKALSDTAARDWEET